MSERAGGASGRATGAHPSAEGPVSADTGAVSVSRAPVQAAAACSAAEGSEGESFSADLPAENAYDRRAEEYTQLLGSMDATTEADRALVGRWADSLRRIVPTSRDVCVPDVVGVRCADVTSDGRQDEDGAPLLLDVGCGPGHWTAWLDARLADGCERSAGAADHRAGPAEAPAGRVDHPASAVADVPLLRTGEPERQGSPRIHVVGIDPAPAFLALARSRFPSTAFRLGRAEELGESDASVQGILAWYSLIHTAPEALPAALTEFARVLAPGGSLLMGFFEGPRCEPFDHAVTTAWFWPVGELSTVVAEAGFVVEETHARHDPGARPHGALLARRR